MASKPIVFASNSVFKYFPNSSGLCVFRVQAANATIGLSDHDTADDIEYTNYDITIGENSVTLSNLDADGYTKLTMAQINTTNILNKDEYRGFWLRWGNKNISLGREGEGCAFMTCDDTVDVNIKWIGFQTPENTTGAWIIGDGQGPFVGEGCQGKGVWLDYSDGNVPANAFIGGIGEAHYVVRCKYNSALIPGKLVTHDKTAYFPADGEEKASSQYEVLCDYTGTWLRITGANIPKNAFLAGHTATDEPLYVGRVFFEEKQTIGKVQRSAGLCVISHGGKEHGLDDYEILVC